MTANIRYRENETLIEVDRKNASNIIEDRTWMIRFLTHSGNRQNALEDTHLSVKS